MSSQRKVFILFIFICKLFFFSESSEVKNYTHLEMIYEDPLVYESWTFTREFYQNSSYIDNDKEICYFLSSNYKYENHNIFIEYIFATKNYKTLGINLYKIIINHNGTEFKSYNHDIDGAWKVLIFEKIDPHQKLLTSDKRFSQFNKIVDKWITKGDKYELLKINNISLFEKVSQIQESNIYICTALLRHKNNNENNESTISEQFLIEEDISSGTMSMRYVIYRNPNK